MSRASATSVPHPRPVPLADIVRELDRLLRPEDFVNDVSHNGLQVEGASQGVTRLCCGVDATPAFYEAALARGAQLLLVHHGISWGSSLNRIAGANCRLVAPLIRADAALYAAHLPLDAHPRFGNNAGLARALGLTKLKPFGCWHGYSVGFQGVLPRPVRWETLLERLAAACPGGELHHVDHGPERVRTVGVVTGGGGAAEYAQALEAGLDAFITGEMNLTAWNAASIGDAHYAAAGHYATERFGIRAITEHIAQRFSLPWDFIDFSVAL